MMDQRLSSGPRMPDSLNGEGALRKALDGPIDGRARKTSNTGDDGNTSSSQSLAIEGCNQVLLSLIEVRKQQGVLPLKFFGFAHSRIIPSPPSFVTLNFLRALTSSRTTTGIATGGVTLAANGQLILPYAPLPWLTCAQGEALDLEFTGAGTLAGTINYVFIPVGGI